MSPVVASSGQRTPRAARPLSMSACRGLVGVGSGSALAAVRHPFCGLDHAQPPRSGDCGLLLDVCISASADRAQRRPRVCSTPWTDLNVHRAPLSCSTQVRIEASGSVVEPAAWGRPGQPGHRDLLRRRDGDFQRRKPRAVIGTIDECWPRRITRLAPLPAPCPVQRIQPTLPAPFEPSGKPPRWLASAGPLIEGKRRKRWPADGTP